MFVTNVRVCVREEDVTTVTTIPPVDGSGSADVDVDVQMSG